ncbi:MAG: trehalose-phosphatase, partial [Alphaproteobacteria bacterium]
MALFLDLDGTLAPIAARPDMVGPDPRRNSLLGELSRVLGGRLAIISGRAIFDVDRILEGCVACVAGLHGLERRGSGGRV